MSDFFPFDVLQEEEEDVVFTLEFDNKLHKRDCAAAIHEKTKAQLQQRKKKGVLVGLHHSHLNALPSMWCYPNAMNLTQMLTRWVAQALE